MYVALLSEYTVGSMSPTYFQFGLTWAQPLRESLWVLEGRQSSCVSSPSPPHRLVNVAICPVYRIRCHYR